MPKPPKSFKSKKSKTPIEKCIACGGTGINSKGWKCVPCLGTGDLANKTVEAHRKFFGPRVKHGS